LKKSFKERANGSDVLLMSSPKHIGYFEEHEGDLHEACKRNFIGCSLFFPLDVKTLPEVILQMRFAFEAVY